MPKGEEIARRSKVGRSSIGSEEESQVYIYLTADEVLVLYADLMNTEGSDPRSLVRDWNLLESALDRPKHAAYYENADIETQAATLLWGIVKNHPFLDGNKRIAHLTAVTFLEVNGYALTATEDEEFELLIGVATGKTLDEVERWVRDHFLPL